MEIPEDSQRTRSRGSTEKTLGDLNKTRAPTSLLRKSSESYETRYKEFHTRSLSGLVHGQILHLLSEVRSG